jgi:O-antigen/teichoic acid export membrane protein
LRARLLRLSKRPFLRSVVVVASGSAASQAITLVFAPLVTRLYGPEAYGVQGVFLMVVSIASAVAALTYPVAIVLPESDADALGLAKLSMTIAVLMSLLISAALFFAGPALLRAINAEQLLDFMYLIPLAVLVAVAGNVLSQWLIRKRAFYLTSTVGAASTALINAAKVSIGTAYPTALALILVNTAGGFLNGVLLYAGWRRCSRGDASPLEKGASSWALAKRYKDFALLRTPQNLLNSASLGLPIILLTTFFGAGSAGFYALASSVLAVPATLVGGSVMQVFYPHFNEAVQKRGDYPRLLLKTTIVMAAVGALPFAVVIGLGPSLFGFVFGAQWSTAGEYAQWLSVWLFFGFLNRPVVSALQVLRRQGVLLVYEICSVVLRTLVLYVGFLLLQDDVKLVAVFSIAGAALNAFLVLYVLRLSRTLWRRQETGP